MPTNSKEQVRYDWGRWFKRKRFLLVRGIHYECLPHGMAQQVRNAAAERGLRVSIRFVDSTLVVENLGAI